MAGWDDLRFFLSVVRTGSLSAAALELGCSQPTVSRRMAALSRRLGAALLRREGTRYSLTAAGARVAAHAESMDHELVALSREVDRLDERPQGSVRLTVPEGIGVRIIAPRLEAFRRQHPGIDLLLVAESTVANLSRREADLALRFVRPRHRELVVRRVARVPFALYATATYLRDRPRTAGALVVPDDDVVALHESFAESPESLWIRANASRARVRVRVRNTMALQAALMSGAGIGLLPDYLGEHPTLRRLGDEPALFRDLYLVFHRALRTTARMRLVARFALECLERRERAA